MSGLTKGATAQTLQAEQKKLDLKLHSLKTLLKSGGTKFERATLAKIIKQVERRNTDPKAIEKAQKLISKNIEESRKKTMSEALSHLSEIHHQREELELKKAELEIEISMADSDSEKSPAVLKKELSGINKALDATKPSLLQRVANFISNPFASEKNEATGVGIVSASASKERVSSSSFAASTKAPHPPPPPPPSKEAIAQLHARNESEGHGYRR